MDGYDASHLCSSQYLPKVIVGHWTSISDIASAGLTVRRITVSMISDQWPIFICSLVFRL